MNQITIANDRLTVTISEMGAEMQSVKDADGRERLWDGDPRFWASHAPMMFPVCGGLKEDRYILDGVSYTMPKHGFAKLLPWKLEEAAADHATYVLTEKHEGFPFDYALHASYTLAGNALTITYRVENRGDRVFWFSIGSHEAYALPGGVDGATVVFDQPETLADYVLDGNLVKREPVILAENATELPLKTEYFAVDALVFPYLKSRGVVLKDAAGKPVVRVDYDGMDVLMLWQKPGAGYLCIEPWCNAPDFVDSDMQIEHKEGMMRLAPGESITKSHTITFL